MKFTNKIEAIKAVRNAGIPKVDFDNATSRYYITTITHGLKEAKDIVEAIMSLGVYIHMEKQRIEIERQIREFEEVREFEEGISLPAQAIKPTIDTW